MIADATAFVADLAPSPGRSPFFWIAIAVAVLVAVMVMVVMAPLRGWKRFQARYGLTRAGERMTGTVSGATLTVELATDSRPPRTRFRLEGTKVFEKEATGRASEAALEAMLVEGLAAIASAGASVNASMSHEPHAEV